MVSNCGLLAVYEADESEKGASVLTAIGSSIAKIFSFGNTPSTNDHNLRTGGEPPISLYQQQSINDPQRRALSASLAPGGSLLAVADALGRVLLADLADLLVVRMFKGYREAQVCFTTVEQQLLMVIYAPRRGLLEAWKVREGARHYGGDIGMGWSMLPADSSLGSSRTDLFMLRGTAIDKLEPESFGNSTAARIDVLGPK